MDLEDDLIDGTSLILQMKFGAKVTLTKGGRVDFLDHPAI